MGRFRLYLLASLAFLFFAFNAFAFNKVCIIDSYKIKITQEIKGELITYLGKERVVDVINHSFPSDCDVKVILGTPGVVRALKNYWNSKVVYSFVLFPEILGLDKKENFYGVRIFPLPQRTVDKFFSFTRMKRRKVAVIVSRKSYKLAKVYLPKNYFKIIVVNSKVEEAFPRLSNYKYIYIFPDPVVLKLVNMLSLVSYAKSNGKLLIAGLPDLDRYDVNFIYAVDFDELASVLRRLIVKTPSEHLLPCPARVRVWRP